MDTSACTADYDERFFASDGLARLGRWLQQDSSSAPRVDPTPSSAPPIARPSKIVCIGLNLCDHAEESKMEIPREPVLFFKATEPSVVADWVCPKASTNRIRDAFEHPLAALSPAPLRYTAPWRHLHYRDRVATLRAVLPLRPATGQAGIVRGHNSIGSRIR